MPALKKRQAHTQTGPKPKKVQLEKPAIAEKKRSRPVTVAIAEASEAASDDEFDDIEGNDDESVDMDNIGDVPIDEDISDTAPTKPIQPKDPNGTSSMVHLLTYLLNHYSLS